MAQLNNLITGCLYGILTVYLVIMMQSHCVQSTKLLARAIIPKLSPKRLYTRCVRLQVASRYFRKSRLLNTFIALRTLRWRMSLTTMYLNRYAFPSNNPVGTHVMIDTNFALSCACEWFLLALTNEIICASLLFTNLL